MFPPGNRIEVEVNTRVADQNLTPNPSPELEANTRVAVKTSPLTPLLGKERGNKAQLYWGEV